jgi:hypothetical protein
MRSRILLAVRLLQLAACASFAACQPAARNPAAGNSQAAQIASSSQAENVDRSIPTDPLNPRHANAFYLGARFGLGPDWLFSPNDNPEYASPTFDDSGWKTVSLNRQLTDYGVRNIPYAWYRFHVHVNHHWRDLAVEVQYTSGSYELYVNGVRIGANGEMNGMREFGQGYLTFYDIPDKMIAPNGDLVIAIRFAIQRMSNQAPVTSTPLTSDCIFLASRDAARRDASYETAHQTMIYLMGFQLNLLVGIVALALYLVMRSQREYLAISIALLATSLQVALYIWGHLHGQTATGDFLVWLAIGVTAVASIEFVRLIVHLRFTRWLLALEIVVLLCRLVLPLVDIGIWGLSAAAGVFAIAAFFAPMLIAFALLPTLLLRAALRGNRDARLFLAPFAFIGFLNYWYFLAVLSFYHLLPVKIPAIPNFRLASYGLNLWDVWGVIYCVVMLLFLVLRTIGIARERARAAAELEAARTVQQVLIPEEAPSAPGFAIHSVYNPAGQVGGDFFQVLALKSGGVIVVIGDVSGKGMPAAMTVSLLVGTVRTLAHYTQSPGEILAAMNQRMMSRSNGGFTTCLVLRVDASGRLTLANAGHLAPYLEGRELPVKNGLPLGISPEATFAESTFQLSPGQQLSLLTDGVVEARNKTGELFGFERAANLSTQPAEAIAQAAKIFGQDDDITVVTVALIA